MTRAYAGFKTGPDTGSDAGREAGRMSGAKPMTSLTADPCKSCMPLGAVTSAYGVRGCVSILHGSQGCSTYIRRHMATHYNEPVDVASSSLTESGTVFGGEANLVKGLDNLIRLYEPELVVVATTCLAETIGEDVPGILRRYREQRPGLGTVLVSAASPGYGGARHEGWFATLAALAAQLPMDGSPHDGINVLIGPSSPADLRALKELLESTGLDFTLVPDISDNLDGPYRPGYSKLPSAGVPIDRLRRMAGARLTLELSLTVPEELSPGAILERLHGVPLIRLAPPVGLRDTDALLAALKDAGGEIGDRVRSERGRYLDATLDAHKHASLGRAAIFGEPDLVLGLARLCAENGLAPVVAATGGRSQKFMDLAGPLAAEACRRSLAASHRVMDRADFADIGAAAAETGANLLVGSGDGRRLAERTGLPLARCGFPVHDHVGGQRIRVQLYQGSLSMLDAMVNHLQDRVEGSFRSALKAEHLPGAAAPPEPAELIAPMPPSGPTAPMAPTVPVEPTVPAAAAGPTALSATAASAAVAAGLEVPKAFGAPAAGRPDGPALGCSGRGPGAAACSAAAEAMEAPAAVEAPAARPAGRADRHPCFSAGASKSFARVHLPVAGDCNLSCGYCSRRHDCANESRPGVASRLLTPLEALERFREARRIWPDLAVAGIAGPGEALADPGPTLETLRLIRREDPGVILCLSTNGLELPEHARDLADLGVTHLTITINAVDPAVGALICGPVRHRGRLVDGADGAAILLANQLAGLAMASRLGLTVKINTVLVDGINGAQAPLVARTAAALGARLGNVMRHIPVPGTRFGDLAPISDQERARVVGECRAHLPQMAHCRQCRADAAGLLGEDCPLDAPHPETARRAASGRRSGGAADVSGGERSRPAPVPDPVRGAAAEGAGLDAAAGPGLGLAAVPGLGLDAAPVPGLGFAAGGEAGEAAPAPWPEPADGGDGGGRSFRIAVVSRSGVVVDQHFGQAGRFMIYESDGMRLRLAEIRRLGPEGGCGRCGRPGGMEKAAKPPEGFIAKMVEACSDCDAVVAIRVGESTKAKLEARGVACFVSTGSLEPTVLAAARRLAAARAAGEGACAAGGAAMGELAEASSGGGMAGASAGG
jgi:nitrogenase molybdenum-iron protein alpha/beta subunit/MoaA/NifB/PqqE/SkfB family radical SAM enzyme/predicted Fe-Mo cluster-binding NifX family protein